MLPFFSLKKDVQENTNAALAPIKPKKGATASPAHDTMAPKGSKTTERRRKNRRRRTRCSTGEQKIVF